MRRHPGFTLVEALVVMAVIAVTAVSLPAFNRFVEGMRVQALLGRLQADFANARMAAISRNQPAMLCPASEDEGCARSTDWSGGWIAFVDPEGDRRPGHASDLLQVGESSQADLRLLSSAGRRELRYLPDGRSAGSNVTFRICSADGERLLARLVVNNAGRARTERPAGEPPCGP